MLQNFCVIHNDLAPAAPKGWLPVGEFKLSEIDFDALVDIYFWDTDFLIAPMLPHKELETLPLVPIQPTLWTDSGTEDDLFNPISLRYPNWEEA